MHDMYYVIRVVNSPDDINKARLSPPDIVRILFTFFFIFRKETVEERSRELEMQIPQPIRREISSSTRRGQSGQESRTFRPLAPKYPAWPCRK